MSDTVLVTGAASGMGRALVQRLVGAGWRVLALDRAAGALDALADELGEQLVPVPVDVTDRAGVTEAVDRLVAGQRLTGVVNCAGIYPPTRLDDFTDETYRAVFDVNVLGTLVVTAAAVPHLRAAGGGAVVNFASVDAFAVSPGQLLYSASKAAVLSLTRSLAIELAPDQVVVNAVAPGWVDTPGNAATGRMAEAAAGIPLGRVADPDEVAVWVQRLLEPGYVTGETVVIAGGSAMR